MRKILTVNLAVMLSFGAAQAQGITLIGEVNCAQWASARETKTAGGFQDYLLGFINGLAIGSENDFWVYPNRIEREQVFYWMDQYCAENPLENVVYGSYAVFEERFGEDWYRR